MTTGNSIIFLIGILQKAIAELTGKEMDVLPTSRKLVPVAVKILQHKKTELILIKYLPAK